MPNPVSPVVHLESAAALRLIYPVLALALLSFTVLALLGFLRVRGMAQRQFPRRYFQLMQAEPGANLPAAALAASRNLINLFEVPVLFYALVPLLLVTGRWNDTSVVLLWVFVALRYAHSAVHLSINVVPLRFSLFLASVLVLAWEWARFALALLASG